MSFLMWFFAQKFCNHHRYCTKIREVMYVCICKIFSTILHDNARRSQMWEKQKKIVNIIFVTTIQTYIETIWRENEEQAQISSSCSKWKKKNYFSCKYMVRLNGDIGTYTRYARRYIQTKTHTQRRQWIEHKAGKLKQCTFVFTPLAFLILEMLC